MKNWVASTICSVALAVSANMAVAETASDRIGAKTDWSIFVADNPTECWVVSSPKSTVNSKNGKVVAVTRSDIRLFVSFRPGSSVAGEVSFTGGYPFKEGSTVNIKIGTASHEMFVDGEYAWPASAGEDSKITTAMKRGSTAVVTGLSSRSTQTEDTFSLLGFTAAIEEAQKRCGQ